MIEIIYIYITFVIVPIINENMIIVKGKILIFPNRIWDSQTET